MFKKLMERFEQEFVGQAKVYYPVKETMYYGRISDKEIEEMQARNQAAIKASIKKLGKKWIMHPAHKVKRVDDGRK